MVVRGDGRMQLVGLIDWIAIGLYIVVAAIALGIFLFLFRKYLTFEEKNRNQLAFCLVFLCFGIGRILLTYFDYFLTEMNPADYVNHQEMWKLATLFELAGLGFLILVSDYAVFKGKDYYGFFIGFVIVICVGLFYPEFLTAQNIIVGALLFAIFIPLSWIYLAVKLPDLRGSIALIFIGFIIFGMGLLLMASGIVAALVFLIDNHSLYLLSAIIQIPGLIILAIGINRMYFIAPV